MNQNKKPHNPRLTAKERGLLKGAMRRVFARSALHQEVLDAQAVEHQDPQRPRCRRWCYCAACGEITPRWCMAVDHIEPLIPVDRSFDQMSIDEVVDRLWCERTGLQGLCPRCHKGKSKAEAKIRAENRKKRKQSQ